MTFPRGKREMERRSFERRSIVPAQIRGVGGVLFLFVVSGLQAGTEADSIAMRARTAVLRSALVPGWGQWTNGRRFKGALIFGAEAGLIVNAVIQNQRARAAGTETERAFYEDNRSLSIWWAVGVYLLNLLDAYVDAELADFDVGPDLGLTRMGPSLGLRCLIPLDLRFFPRVKARG